MPSSLNPSFKFNYRLLKSHLLALGIVPGSTKWGKLWEQKRHQARFKE